MSDKALSEGKWGWEKVEIIIYFCYGFLEWIMRNGKMKRDDIHELRWEA